MNGGQAGVACGDAVVSLRFKVIEKRENMLCPKVL